MATLFNRFHTWLLDNRKTLLSRFTTDEKETPEPEKSLIELPPHLASKLIAAVDELPTDNPDMEAIQSTLDEAFEKWRSNPQAADNSVVILSSPVTTVSRTLTESLLDWASEREIPLRPLQWIGRPEKAEDIKTKLQHQLGRGLVTTSKQPEVVVITNLSWCFLRCVDGLEGIDYLQDVLLQDDSRFWVIGAGKVGWEYLDHVSHFKAYCGDYLELPRLTGEQLQAWFEPIVDEFQISFAKPNIEFPNNNEEDESRESRYFEKLADLSEGVNTVAVQVFLSSIRYQPEDSDNPESDNTEGILEAQNPELPNLPHLSADEHYILYSLLLHGDLNLSALSESLGDEKTLVKGQVQRLRRKGLVEQKHEILTINPIHYPRLKNELANNNFIIYESD